MIEVGGVYQINDPDDLWDGEKVIVKNITYTRSGYREYTLVRWDGEISPFAGGNWCRRCLKRIG